MTAISSIALSAAPGSAIDQNKKIDKSAKDFEAMLLGNWLQEAENSFAKVPGTDEEEGDDDGAAQMRQGLATQQLGEAMAASGGIGIARIIAGQLRRSNGSSPEQAIAAKLNNSQQMPISRVLP